MNKNLLNKEVQEFLRNYDGETAALAFKGSPFTEISTSELLQQIEGYRKSESKLPSWHSTPNTLFPPKLNIEQTSSEVAATYKADLISGASMADLTGGFGVDTYFFSKQFKEVLYVEQNTALYELAKHNFTMLGATHISCINDDGLAQLTQKKFDLIYLDPARRHESKGKVFFLKDCEPNVVESLDQLLQHTTTLLIKTSPMLDISIGLKELDHVQEVHVVAVQNEVKELLWLLSKDNQKPIQIITVNILQEATQYFEFNYQESNHLEYCEPSSYLYEPNAAILKAGAFNDIAAAYPICKLAPHSHLYTSNELKEFPGRRFKINQVIPYKKGSMKTLTKLKANVTTRNFPETVAQLRKKWKIAEGGDRYLFFTTLNSGEKVVLDTQKVEV